MNWRRPGARRLENGWGINEVIDYIDIDGEAWWTNKELILVCSDGGARWLRRDQRISEDETTSLAVPGKGSLQ
jgi:hypothetical protein